jgi:hypothetical protein
MGYSIHVPCRTKRADKYIKAELARLDELWENR